MTYSTIEKDFPFAELEGSEDEIKLGNKIRTAYIDWQLNLSSPYIELNDIKRSDSDYWIQTHSWILKGN